MLIIPDNRIDKAEPEGRRVISLLVCTYVFMYLCVHVHGVDVTWSLWGWWRSGERRKGGGCGLEWLVHGQVCSQSCVGKRYITKSESWFLIQLIFV